MGAFTTVPTTTIESNLAQYTGGYDTVVADVQWTADQYLWVPDVQLINNATTNRSKTYLSVSLEFS